MFTSIIALAALVISLVNAVAVYLRIGHDVKLRKAELAMRMVEAEYHRAGLAKEPYNAWPPTHILDLFLPAVDEIYRKGTFDVKQFVERSDLRVKQFREMDESIVTRYSRK